MSKKTTVGIAHSDADLGKPADCTRAQLDIVKGMIRDIADQTMGGMAKIVKRGDKVGVRVKDTESETRREFKGLEYYPIDPKWRIEARLEPYTPPKAIPITNVLGITEDETSPGALAFEVDGKTYRIDPILEKGETDLFVMIADQTTGKETYGAGRYLYVSPPDANGKVVIDFNKTYSPPCAFTNFATCPLPPQQNHLPFRIDAGEKKYTGTVH